MKVATAAQMREMDRRAIEEYGIPGLVLMENAGLRVVEVVRKILAQTGGNRVSVVAGRGNNGGDGFVVARHLYNTGIEVSVFLFGSRAMVTGDALVNLEILEQMGLEVEEVREAGTTPCSRIQEVLRRSSVVVDALLGTGISGEVREPAASAIALINDSQRPVVAVDIPSGIHTDTGQVLGDAVRATTTVTFALPKPGLLVYPGAGYCGRLVVADISIPKAVTGSVETDIDLVTSKAIARHIKPRRPDTHKGHFGRVLVVAGSPGLTGAAVLAALGALRGGAGLVTLAVPASVHDIVEVKVTEVMTTPLPEGARGCLGRGSLDRVLSLAREADVVAVGPGLSQAAGVREFMTGLVANCPVPLVIDADGLNVLSGNLELLAAAGAPVVITPHPGEMARLLDCSPSDVQGDRFGSVRLAARRAKAVTVLKGARTLVCSAGGHRVFINPTGGPAMATGGSGDVLTGLIAGFMGQGMEPLDAGVVGTWIHGAAGQEAARVKGERGLVAGDILEAVPRVLRPFEEGCLDGWETLGELSWRA